MKKIFFAVTVFVLSISLLGGCRGENASSLDIHVPAPAQKTEDEIIDLPAELLAFRFDGYEDLSISDYRAKAFGVIAQNEAKYLALIDRVSTGSDVQDIRYVNEDAYFIANILIPTISENWNTWKFNNSIIGDYYSAEYSICYTIINSDQITMGKRNEALSAIMNGIQETIESRSAEQLSDEAGTQAALDVKVEELAGKYTTDSFQIHAELLYRSEPAESHKPGEQRPIVEERGRIGTEADYRLLLSLKTDGYKDLSVSDFLQDYSELAQTHDFGDAYARVSRDISCNDVHVAVTDEEMEFLNVTLEATSQEFIAKFQNHNELSTLRYRIEKQLSETAKGQDMPVFELLLDYDIMYSVSDDTELTVGERDAVLFAIKNSIESFVDSQTIDQLAIGKLALEVEIEKLEQQYSNSKMEVTIKIISYHAVDQRSDIQSLS